MADTTPIKLRQFSDIYLLTENRCNIATPQDRERNLIKGAINEAYQLIATERPWRWKSFDRDIVFKRAVTTGTAEVENDSREVIITGLTIDQSFKSRSIKFDSNSEIYRIIGVNTSTNRLYLSAAFVGSDDTDATYKIYQYEFLLPPDCDTVNGLYIDSPRMTYGESFPDLTPMNNEDFNRQISMNGTLAARPSFYTRDGQTTNNATIPLGEMIPRYDFLGGYELTGEKLRLYPLEPDQDRIIHLNYSLEVPPLMADEDKPLMSPSDRWALVHYARYIYLSKNGSITAAREAYSLYEDILNRMRAEHHKTDRRMKFVNPMHRYQRNHYVNFFPKERSRLYE